jgi:deazaflavin-dependent oxidoreductase (nitroreductase family)
MITRAAMRVHRLTGNKMGGRPLLYLSTIGAKSGQRRTNAVIPFADGEDAWLIVASRAGAADHPAWFYNLVKSPDLVEVEVEGRRTAVAPEVLTGAERAAAWERITQENAGYARYQEKTDREIPVVRLTSRGEGGPQSG